MPNGTPPPFGPGRLPGERPPPGGFRSEGWRVGGDFLNAFPGPTRPNLNAYLAFWRTDMDINQIEARALYEVWLETCRELNILNTEFDDYADLNEVAVLLPETTDDIVTPTSP
jgi:hypothetical protein